MQNIFRFIVLLITFSSFALSKDFFFEVEAFGKTWGATKAAFDNDGASYTNELGNYQAFKAGKYFHDVLRDNESIKLYAITYRFKETDYATYQTKAIRFQSYGIGADYLFAPITRDIRPFAGFSLLNFHFLEDNFPTSNWSKTKINFNTKQIGMQAGINYELIDAVQASIGYRYLVHYGSGDDILQISSQNTLRYNLDNTTSNLYGAITIIF